MDSSGGLLAGGSFVSVDGKRVPGLAYLSSQTAPSAPRTVSVDAVGRQILVQWSDVTSTPRVTRYEAKCTRVRAQNSVGWGAWSTAAEVRVR